MDFIFDEDVDEVGAEIEAFCPKCKADTTHVVISKYEDEIRRVQCNPCGDVHPFRKPRGEVEEDTPAEPVSAKKRAAKVKPTWEQVMAKPKKEPKLYLVAQAYKENELIAHPKFGAGFVSEVIPPDKIEVTFQSGRRILIHNRSGMSLPPAAYSHPVDVTLQLKPAGKGGKASAKAGGADGKAPPAAVGKPADKKGAAKPVDAKKGAASDKKPVAVEKGADKKPAASKAPPIAAGKKPVEKAPAKPAPAAGKKPAAVAARPSPAAKPKAKPPVKAAAKPVAKKPAARPPEKKPAVAAQGKKDGEAVASARPSKTKPQARAAAPARAKPAAKAAAVGGKKAKKR